MLPCQPGNNKIRVFIWVSFDISNVYFICDRFANILHAVHSCGEYDRLMQGVFENYPNIKFKDSYLNAVLSIIKKKKNTLDDFLKLWCGAVSGMHWIGLDVLLRSRQPFHPTKPKLLRVWLLALRFHRIALSDGSGSLAENSISNSSNRGIGP